MLDLKPKWYPSLPLEVAVIWHTHELPAVEPSDSDCVWFTGSCFSQAIFVQFQLSQHKFFKRKGRGKKSYTVLGFFVGGGFFCFFSCMCDLDGFTERCDMLKMELR